MSTTETDNHQDIAAALYHLHDLCDEGDTMDVVTAPHRVQLNSRLTASAAAVGVSVSAVAGVVKYTTPNNRRQHQHQHEQQQQQETAGDQAVASSSAAAGPSRSEYSSHFLLVRLPEKGSDLLVFVNVPRVEFYAQGNPGALTSEELLASELVERYIDVINVVDWDLFG